ncbi:hypothetical protein ACFL1B_00755 [Nanoarchaeota archaeon]
MDSIDDIRKKVKKELEEDVDVDPDSDHPIHEKYTKQKKFKK